MKDTRPVIVVFGSDLDLCENLSLLFQGTYRVMTPEDYDRLDATLCEHRALALIADVQPSIRLATSFDRAKKRTPAMKIVLFYASRFLDRADDVHADAVWKHVDTVLFKPVDLDVVMRIVDDQLSALKPSHHTSAHL